MGGQSLLEALKELFEAEAENGVTVDRIGLTSAYQGIVGESYILSISSPSLSQRYDCDSKTDAVVRLLFKHLNEDQRALIDRVRVYSSAEDFDFQLGSSGGTSYYGYCEALLSGTISHVYKPGKVTSA